MAEVYEISYAIISRMLKLTKPKKCKFAFQQYKPNGKKLREYLVGYAMA